MSATACPLASSMRNACSSSRTDEGGLAGFLTLIHVLLRPERSGEVRCFDTMRSSQPLVGYVSEMFGVVLAK